METENPARPLIVVMANAGRTYAWDRMNTCLGEAGLRMIAERYPDHPALSELVDLDFAFWAWAGRQPRAGADSPLQWRDFHVSGLVLARQLAELMRPLGVMVLYRGAPGPYHLLPLQIGPL